MRLNLKKGFERLNSKDQEEHFNNLTALDKIDPYRSSRMGLFFGLFVIEWLWGFVTLMKITLFVYVLWCILYGITFLGVYHIYNGFQKK